MSCKPKGIPQSCAGYVAREFWVCRSPKSDDAMPHRGLIQRFNLGPPRRADPAPAPVAQPHVVTFPAQLIASMKPVLRQSPARHRGSRAAHQAHPRTDVGGGVGALFSHHAMRGRPPESSGSPPPPSHRWRRSAPAVTREQARHDPDWSCPPGPPATVSPASEGRCTTSFRRASPCVRCD